MDWLLSPEVWVALATLTLLEVVLGIDNVIFISILCGKLPESQRRRARNIGLSLALITRVLLLLGLKWMMGLTQPLFSLTLPWMSHAVGLSGKDLILVSGGLFLIWKSVHEIHEKLEGTEGHVSARVAPRFSAVIGQIIALDIVFSLDSVITAVGMANQIGVMIAAVMIAVGVMLAYAGAISDFVERHPTVKMLALAFLVLIGVNLLAEGFHAHIEKGYTYFAMVFAVAVEGLNLRVRARQAPVHLRHPIAEPETAGDPPGATDPEHSQSR